MTCRVLIVQNSKLTCSPFAMTSKRTASPSSIIDISDSASSEFIPKKRNVAQVNKRKQSSTSTSSTRIKRAVLKEETDTDIEDIVGDSRPHAASYHVVCDVILLQEKLLDWFEGVR